MSDAPPTKKAKSLEEQSLPRPISEADTTTETRASRRRKTLTGIMVIVERVLGIAEKHYLKLTATERAARVSRVLNASSTKEARALSRLIETRDNMALCHMINKDAFGDQRAELGRLMKRVGRVLGDFE